MLLIGKIWPSYNLLLLRENIFSSVPWINVYMHTNLKILLSVNTTQTTVSKILEREILPAWGSGCASSWLCFHLWGLNLASQSIYRRKQHKILKCLHRASQRRVQGTLRREDTNRNTYKLKRQRSGGPDPSTTLRMHRKFWWSC